MSRYGIAEWFGLSLTSLTPTQRQDLAQAALGNEPPLPCPFQANQPPCRKSGGVCSFELYGEGENGRIGEPEAAPVIICPARFEQDRMIIRWLAEIVGFQPNEYNDSQRNTIHAKHKHQQTRRQNRPSARENCCRSTGLVWIGNPSCLFLWTWHAISV